MSTPEEQYEFDLQFQLQNEDEFELFSLFPKTLTVLGIIHLFVILVVLAFYLNDRYNGLKMKLKLKNKKPQ